MQPIILGMGAYLITFLLDKLIRVGWKRYRQPKKPASNPVADLMAAFNALLRRIAADLRDGQWHAGISAMAELLKTEADLLEEISHSHLNPWQISIHLENLVDSYKGSPDFDAPKSLVSIEVWLFNTTLMTPTPQRIARLQRRGWFGDRLPPCEVDVTSEPRENFLNLDDVDKLWDLITKTKGDRSIFDDDETKTPGGNLDDTLDHFPIPETPPSE